MGENIMNILITGAMGFIGKHLRSKLNTEHNGSLTLYDLALGDDIRNLHDLDKAFEASQCTTVIHLAARAGVRRGNAYPHEYMTTNIEGTLNIGKMCEKYGCRLISFSSSSVFGDAAPPIVEHAPKNPVNLYGMTKLMGEHIVNRLTVPTTIIRPFTVYGKEGRRDQVFYKWLTQYQSGKPITVYGNGSSMRGYTYVDDLVQAVCNLALMETWPWEHEHFNLGGNERISLSSVMKIFQEIIPDAAFEFLPQQDCDVDTSFANTEKAAYFLNWNPPRTFREHLIDIILSEIGGIPGTNQPN